MEANIYPINYNSVRHDRQLCLLTCGTRRSKTGWLNTQMSWSEFALRFQTPNRTRETVAEYEAKTKAEQTRLKDVGGYVGGEFSGNSRKAQELKGRDLIVLDLDYHIAAGCARDIISQVKSRGCAMLVHTTRSHRPDRPRLRVIIPTDRTMTPDEYEPAARQMAHMLGVIGYCDPTTFQANRLMFFPSCSADAEYIYEFVDNNFASVDGLLGTFDWHDFSKWPTVPNESVTYRTDAKKQQDPKTKSGIVGAFCRTYNVHTAIEKFLGHIYQKCGEDRYTYIEGTTSGGAVTYEDGDFIFSHHATDPCSCQLCNAFDMVRLHLFGDKDTDRDLDTPEVKTPSFLEMCKWVHELPEVQTVIHDENLAQIIDSFPKIADWVDLEIPAERKEDTSWRKLLKTKKGSMEVLGTIDNALLILENDFYLKDRIAFDRFCERIVNRQPLPWGDDRTGREWTDNDDNNLQLYFEKGYGLRNSTVILKAFDIAAHRRAFNSVEEYLNGIRWDGVNRVTTLFIDYLGCADNEYTRQVATVTLVGAVRRAVISGCKWDYVPILVGPQGKGKSKFLASLGMEWFSDSIQGFDGKEAAELLQGTWINELPELAGFNKSETNRIKQFITKTDDYYRSAYGRRSEHHPRHCVFIGTTNDDEFLKDPTGNRRYWPVNCFVNEPAKNIDDLYNSRELVGQIWAEAYDLYKSDLVQPWLTGSALDIARNEQESHKITDNWQGIIEAYLETGVPPTWNTMDRDTRKLHLSNQMDGDCKIDKVCVMEIWCEALNGDPQRLGKIEQLRIGAIMRNMPGWEQVATIRTAYCGRQKGYRRVGLSTDS